MISICPVTLTSRSTIFKILVACSEVNDGRARSCSSAAVTADIASRLTSIEPVKSTRKFFNRRFSSIFVSLKPISVAKY